MSPHVASVSEKRRWQLARSALRTLQHKPDTRDVGVGTEAPKCLQISWAWSDVSLEAEGQEVSLGGDVNTAVAGKADAVLSVQAAECSAEVVESHSAACAAEEAEASGAEVSIFRSKTKKRKKKKRGETEEECAQREMPVSLHSLTMSASMPAPGANDDGTSAFFERASDDSVRSDGADRGRAKAMAGEEGAEGKGFDQSVGMCLSKAFESNPHQMESTFVGSIGGTTEETEEEGAASVCCHSEVRASDVAAAAAFGNRTTKAHVNGSAFGDRATKAQVNGAAFGDRATKAQVNGAAPDLQVRAALSLLETQAREISNDLAILWKQHEHHRPRCEAVLQQVIRFLSRLRLQRASIRLCATSSLWALSQQLAKAAGEQQTFLRSIESNGGSGVVDNG